MVFCYYSKFVENRQSLRKESSAKMPVRRGALAKYRKQQELQDPLAAVSSLSDSRGRNSSFIHIFLYLIIACILV